MKLKTAAIAAFLAPVLLSAGIFDQLPCNYPTSRASQQVFDEANHRLTRMSTWGDQFELEDGSVWKASNFEGKKNFHWYLDDPLTITQNTSWAPGPKYRIKNLRNGDSVAVYGLKSPTKNGAYTRVINAINWETHQILLNDGTCWEVSQRDLMWSHFDWAPNDSIIIGINSGWDSSAPAILINANMDQFVRVKQL